MTEWISLSNDVALFKVPVSPLAMEIGKDGNSLVFNWNSKMGKFYDLLSGTDLSSPAEDWLPYNDGATTYSDIATPGVGTNELINILPQEEKRFFVLKEKIRPTP